MKIKVTENIIKRKSVLKLPVKHSDAIYYRVPSVTLQKNTKTKTLFIWYMVRSFQQFYDSNNDEEPTGTSNILFGRLNTDKEYQLVRDIDNYETGHIFTVSENENTTSKEGVWFLYGICKYFFKCSIRKKSK